MRSMGGDVEFKYDHSTYWPALNRLAEQRRTEYRHRWIQGGKHIGEYEKYLKTGDGPSLARKQDDSNGAVETSEKAEPTSA